MGLFGRRKPKKVNVQLDEYGNVKSFEPRTKDEWRAFDYDKERKAYQKARESQKVKSAQYKAQLEGERERLKMKEGGVVARFVKKAVKVQPLPRRTRRKGEKGSKRSFSSTSRPLGGFLQTESEPARMDAPSLMGGFDIVGHSGRGIDVVGTSGFSQEKRKKRRGGGDDFDIVGV